MRRGSRWTTVVAASLLLTACGAPGPASPADVNDVNASRRPPSAAAAGETVGTQQRMQGTWEIVRYTSERPIPDAAMPLMGNLFDSLRLRFEGNAVAVRTGRQAEERGSFTVTDERGDAFRLVVKGGLFDGARCRFVDADTWEATDHGAAWPGVSVLRRVGR